MTNSRYLIAKYIPDLRRVEPRNVGVVLWTPEAVVARFIAEKYGRTGEVDGRSIPGFVTSTAAYRQWIEFWRGELEKGQIKSVQSSGHFAARTDPEFLDVLMESNRGNFVLTEGGMLLDRVDNPENALDFLFPLLVDSVTGDEPRDPTLDEVCDRLIEETSLRANPNFHSGFEVLCPLSNETEERFVFNYAYKNGSIKRLYQRVPLTRRRGILRKTVHDAAWMFDKVVKSRIVTVDQAVALVYLTEAQSAEGDGLLKVLRTVSRVVNVGDEPSARDEFASLAGPS